MYKTVNDKENNVVLHDRVSKENFVFQYEDDCSFILIYGPEISSAFNLMPLNLCMDIIGDAYEPYKLQKEYKGLTVDEQKEAHRMVEQAAKIHLKWDEIGWLSGGLLRLYNSILECMLAIKHKRCLFWPFPETHLHPSVGSELPMVFLRLMYGVYRDEEEGLEMLHALTGKDCGFPSIKNTEGRHRKTSKPIVVPTNSEHLMLRTMRLIREKSIHHRRVMVMHLERNK
tara:strand:+ start:22 stop:705 length:684 start_codon:yes stop_codon:yes gene_type:complete